MKHPRISDFGTINGGTAEIQLYFLGGRLGEPTSLSKIRHAGMS